MKNITLITTFSVILTVSLVIFISISKYYKGSKTDKSDYSSLFNYDTPPLKVGDSMSIIINRTGKMMAKKYSASHNRNLDKMEQVSEISPTQFNNSNIMQERKFWIKLIFSSILLAASLFVILSRKYDVDTKKWAVSALTMIAGVWIGTL